MFYFFIATCDDFRTCLVLGNWFNVYENVLSLEKISDIGAKGSACVKLRRVNVEGGVKFSAT